MKTYKIEELEGALLDAAVAKAEGHKPYYPEDSDNPERFNWLRSSDTSGSCRPTPHYSRDWERGGPIIEREKIDLMHVEYRGPAMGGKPSEPWNAMMQNLAIDNADWDSMSGPTPMVAAMRAFVASKFGETVEL